VFIKSFQQEEAVLSTLATQAAISLDNANLYHELGDKARMQGELEIARGIQMSQIPQEADISGIKIKGICLPANEVGGDFLDFFENQKGELVLMIADVCGKGVPAALMTTSLRSCLRIIARNKSSSKDILNIINAFMGVDLMRERSFITCTCIVINQERTSMSYCRAGHPLMIKLKGDSSPESIESEGISLGMVGDKQFNEITEELTLPFNSGEKYVIHTDGLDEARDQDNNLYGMKRYHQFLKNNKAKDPDGLIEDILNEWKTFCQGQRQYDDLTLLAFERN
jgi:sigma-B regulation protein RsbU (phosphoserine phosphatase)